MSKPMKNIFRSGAIQPSMIADSIAKHQHKTDIGGHYLFLGQVRADEIEGKKVSAIHYSAQEELANKVVHEIRERDRKSTRLNSSHVKISYAVFCLKKKKHSADRSKHG